MGVRYQNSFYSYSGVNWVINLYDSDYNSGSTLFKTGVEGFSLPYKQVTERLDSIMSSSVTIPCIVEDSAFETFLTDIMTSQEERFAVKIFKNTVLYWAGVLLADIVQKEDINYPYTVDLTFTDGLGRLQDLDYNDGAATPAVYTGSDTIMEHLVKILGKTGVPTLYGTNDAFLQTTVNWYDANQSYYTYRCPLAYTRINHTVFYSYDDKGNISYKKTSDVLKMILGTFNARILMAEGMFQIVQPQEYARPTTYARIFKKSGALLTYTNAKSFRITPATTTRKTGGITKYYAPLKKVMKKYKPRRSPYDNDSILPVPLPLTNAVTTLLSSVDENDTILIEGTITTKYRITSLGHTPPNLWSQFLLRVKLTPVSIGDTLWLSNTNVPNNNEYCWHTYSSSFAIKIGPFDGDEWVEEYPVSLTLPAILSEYTGEFQLYLMGLYTGPGYPYTLQSWETWSYSLSDFKMTPTYTLAADATFTALNTSTSGNPVNSTLEINQTDVLIGDGPTKKNIGKLTVNNGGPWVDSTLWGIHNSTNRFKIHQLSVDQNLSGQRIPTEKYQGSFINSSITALSSLVIGSKVMVPISVTVNPVTDEITGEWFNCIIPVL